MRAESRLGIYETSRRGGKSLRSLHFAVNIKCHCITGPLAQIPHPLLPSTGTLSRSHLSNGIPQKTLYSPLQERTIKSLSGILLSSKTTRRRVRWTTHRKVGGLSRRSCCSCTKAKKTSRRFIGIPKSLVLSFRQHWMVSTYSKQYLFECSRAQRRRMMYVTMMYRFVHGIMNGSLNI